MYDVLWLLFTSQHKAYARTGVYRITLGDKISHPLGRFSELGFSTTKWGRTEYDEGCVYATCVDEISPKKATIFVMRAFLEPQSRFGDKPLKFQVVCPHNGTALIHVLGINRV